VHTYCMYQCAVELSCVQYLLSFWEGIYASGLLLNPIAVCVVCAWVSPLYVGLAPTWVYSVQFKCCWRWDFSATTIKILSFELVSRTEVALFSLSACTATLWVMFLSCLATCIPTVDTCQVLCMSYLTLMLLIRTSLLCAHVRRLLFTLIYV